MIERKTTWTDVRMCQTQQLAIWFRVSTTETRMSRWELRKELSKLELFIFLWVEHKNYCYVLCLTTCSIYIAWLRMNVTSCSTIAKHVSLPSSFAIVVVFTWKNKRNEHKIWSQDYSSFFTNKSNNNLKTLHVLSYANFLQRIFTLYLHSTVEMKQQSHSWCSHL